jgi:flagellar protein FliO/FliZ
MQQEAGNRKQKTGALSRLRHIIHANVPLRGVPHLRYPLAFIFCLLSSGVAAEETRAAYVPPPPAVSTGSIMQIVFSLLLVLVVIVLVGWLLKRINVAQQGSGNLLKVLGGVSIGQRERIVLVEVKDTWLLIGVGPGQIRTLHTLEKPESSGQDAEVLSSGGERPKGFAAALSAALGSLSQAKHKQQLATDDMKADPSQVNGRSRNAP